MFLIMTLVSQSASGPTVHDGAWPGPDRQFHARSSFIFVYVSSEVKISWNWFLPAPFSLLHISRWRFVHLLPRALFCCLCVSLPLILSRREFDLVVVRVSLATAAPQCLHVGHTLHGFYRVFENLILDFRNILNFPVTINTALESTFLYCTYKKLQ